MAVKNAIRRLVPHSLWNGLRAARRRLSVRRFSPKIVEHRLGLTTRKIWIADPLGESWYDHDWDELPELEHLRGSRLREGGRVFDLGAHQGVVALMLAEQVGSGGQVIAVEMNPHNAAVAGRNRELNDMTQITIRNAAVAETAGTVRFDPNLNAAIDEAQHWSSQEIDALSIDDLTLQYGAPDVLYLDIEGYECRALKGATRTLSQRPDCFIEVHVGHGLETFGGSVDEVLSHFPGDAYRLLMCSPAESRFVSFDATSPIVRDRFYLLALATSGDGSPSDRGTGSRPIS